MIWNTFWSLAGRVPLRYKIMGIIVAPLLILGFTIAWWVSNQLGGWLSYLLSEERVAQAMAVGMRSVFIITLFAALAGLLIGSFLTWLLTRPLLEMAYVARHAKEGDLSVRAPVWANDEIGELGIAFNDMIATLDISYKELEHSNIQLKQRNQELGVLYQLANMASKSFTMQQISAHGLQQALDNAGASAGLIVLRNERGPILSSSTNLPEAFLNTVVSCLQEFDFTCVQFDQDNQTILLDSADHSGVLPSTILAEVQKLHYPSILVAPIWAKNKILGLIFILGNEPERISQQHHQLISGICNQLSTAIQNAQLWNELRRKEQSRTQLLSKVVSAQEDERQRISRELHDETGQSLTSLLVQLKILERCNTPEEVRAYIEGIRRVVLQTLQEVRRLAADLRPAALDDLGLISALEGYIYDFINKSGLRVDFVPQNLEDIRLPRDMEIVVYRVIQESLTNIVRHAQASLVQISIVRVNQKIEVTIVDDGCGFDAEQILAAKDRGLGLLGMQERIELLGGHFALSSEVGQGTRIDVELTVPDDS